MNVRANMPLPDLQSMHLRPAHLVPTYCGCYYVFSNVSVISQYMILQESDTKSRAMAGFEHHGRSRKFLECSVSRDCNVPISTPLLLARLRQEAKKSLEGLMMRETIITFVEHRSVPDQERLRL